MAKRYEIYKCEACGNIVMVLTGGAGELVCCGEPMQLMKPQTAEMKNEKHVPVVEKVEGGYRVVVGSTEHPMVDAHYIEWIALATENQSYFEFLKPGMKPEVFFPVDAKAIEAYEYCNLHGLWMNDLVGGKQEEAKEEKASNSQMYLCTACQYIYDPEVGDPDSGIEPGTAFEDIPDDWVCPICGVGKDMFEPYEG